MIDLNDFANHPVSYWEQRYLVRGQNYCVRIPFVDADGVCRSAGEEWTFIGSSFSALEDEYTLCVRLKTGQISLLRLRSDHGQQGEVIRHPHHYLVAVL